MDTAIALGIAFLATIGATIVLVELIRHLGQGNGNGSKSPN